MLLMAKPGLNIYDARAATYGQLPWVNDEVGFKHICDMARGFKAKAIIDLGCGTSKIAAYAQKRYPGLRYIGIDLSNGMLRKAQENTNKLESVLLMHKDIRDDSFQLSIPGSVILLKNVLHLIPNYIDFVKGLPKRFVRSKYIIIVETVSPDNECLEWVQGLFWRLGLQAKENWFERVGFERSFQQLGVELLCHRYHEQSIDIENWVGSYGLSPVQRSGIDSYFDQIPAHVRDAMQIRSYAQGHSLLRLQVLFALAINDLR